MSKSKKKKVSKNKIEQTASELVNETVAAPEPQPEPQPKPKSEPKPEPKVEAKKPTLSPLKEALSKVEGQKTIHRKEFLAFKNEDDSRDWRIFMRQAGDYGLEYFLFNKDGSTGLGYKSKISGKDEVITV